MTFISGIPVDSDYGQITPVHILDDVCLYSTLPVLHKVMKPLEVRQVFDAVQVCWACFFHFIRITFNKLTQSKEALKNETLPDCIPSDSGWQLKNEQRNGQMLEVYQKRSKNIKGKLNPRFCVAIR